jgi:hypothetical protein
VTVKELQDKLSHMDPGLRVWLVVYDVLQPAGMIRIEDDHGIPRAVITEAY